MTARPRGLPARIETILFDAGGVLLDLDYRYLRRLCRAHGWSTDEAALSLHEARARVDIHRAVAGGGTVGAMWRDYFHHILGKIGVSPDEQPGIIDSLWEAHRRFGLWTVPVEGAVSTVRSLKRAGYRVGVVSNAEGRVAQDLDGAGFEGLFETVVDSHRVGFEKPDPRIFEVALERITAARETTLFVGDVPAVDVEGARAAGLAAVLLDRHGLYADEDVPRLRSIAQLAEWLPDAP